MALLKKDLDKRRKFILPYIRGKKVLDLGPGDISDRFLHKFVVKHAKSTVGLELFKKRADQLNKVGYNIKVGNAQDYNLKEKFDVIIAGDLIEHLTNFEGFLESTKKHMNKDSRLILNTPNAFSFWTLSGIIRKPFKEHTCWFCKYTMKQLLDQFDMEIEKFEYYSNDFGTFKGKIMHGIFSLRPHWNEHMMFVIKLKDKRKKSKK